MVCIEVNIEEIIQNRYIPLWYNSSVPAGINLSQQNSNKYAIIIFNVKIIEIKNICRKKVKHLKKGNLQNNFPTLKLITTNKPQ